MKKERNLYLLYPTGSTSSPRKLVMAFPFKWRRRWYKDIRVVSGVAVSQGVKHSGGRFELVQID